MQILNFTTLYISTFLIIVGGSLFLLYTFYKKREKIKKDYLLLFEQSKSYYYRYTFLIISLIIMSLGIFSISLPSSNQKAQIHGVDIVFVLDVSKSMNVQDIQYKNGEASRLDFSKEIINQYILENSQNRFGLIIFAGNAIGASPLTSDHSTFLTFLKNVDYKNINSQGSSLEKAQELGVERLSVEEDKRSKVLIMISDGGDNDETLNIKRIEKSFSNADIVSMFLGVGTLSGGRIPNGIDLFGKLRYQTYKGEEVIVNLNEKNLKNIANSIAGNYYKISTIGQVSQVHKHIGSLEKKAHEISGVKSHKNISRILGVVSLFFFILYLIFPTRRKVLGKK